MLDVINNMFHSIVLDIVIGIGTGTPDEGHGDSYPGVLVCLLFLAALSVRVVFLIVKKLYSKHRDS